MEWLKKCTVRMQEVDTLIKVPVGTVITNEETGNQIMADLTEDKQRVVLAKGGSWWTWKCAFCDFTKSSSTNL